MELQVRSGMTKIRSQQHGLDELTLLDKRSLHDVDNFLYSIEHRGAIEYETTAMAGFAENELPRAPGNQSSFVAGTGPARLQTLE